MWSVALTDLLQAVVIVVGMGYVAWMVSDLAGGAGRVVEMAAAEGRMRFLPEADLRSVLAWITAALVIALGMAVADDGPRDGPRIILCLALLGACLGFLPHNFSPATIFLGDSGSLLLGFLLIAGQLVRLAVKAPAEFKLSLAEPMAKSWARPDIIDRHGHLLATDVATHSLYADPQLVQDVDEAIEKLTAALPALDAAELRKTLSDKSRRFAWVARGLTPRQAQEVHALGLPGLALRTEPRRVYPLGPLTGHLLGTVNTDNRGIAGIEIVRKPRLLTRDREHFLRDPLVELGVEEFEHGHFSTQLAAIAQGTGKMNGQNAKRRS